MLQCLQKRKERLNGRKRMSSTFISPVSRRSSPHATRPHLPPTQPCQTSTQSLLTRRDGHVGGAGLHVTVIVGPHSLSLARRGETIEHVSQGARARLSGLARRAHRGEGRGLGGFLRLPLGATPGGIHVHPSGLSTATLHARSPPSAVRTG